MKELQFTLYEVFGYLLPGAVLTGGVSLIFWAAFFPQTAIDFDIKTVEVWGTFLVLSYVAGHIAQGIGNAIVRRFESAEEHAINTTLDPEIIAACKKKAKEVTGADVEKVKPRWLYCPELYDAINADDRNAQHKPQCVVVSERRKRHENDGNTDARYYGERGGTGVTVTEDGKVENGKPFLSTKGGHHILIIFNGTGPVKVHIDTEPDNLLPLIKSSPAKVGSSFKQAPKG